MQESRALNTALQKYHTKQSAHEREKLEREELLNRQFTANDNSVSDLRSEMYAIVILSVFALFLIQ